MSFDILAPHYRWMEWVLAGEKLQRCRTKFLGDIPAPRNILLLGEGPGRGLVECCRRFGRARITCVDGSPRMLTQARRQLQRDGLSADRVTFVRADALSWTPAGEAYDLICTNFFLDCFRPDQLARLVSQIARAATPEANWLIADFQVPARGLRRLRGRLIVALMYGFFRALTGLTAKQLTAPAPYLIRAGFNLRRRSESEWGLLQSDWWCLGYQSPLTLAVDAVTTDILP